MNKVGHPTEITNSDALKHFQVRSISDETGLLDLPLALFRSRVSTPAEPLVFATSIKQSNDILEGRQCDLEPPAWEECSCRARSTAEA